MSQDEASCGGSSELLYEIICMVESYLSIIVCSVLEPM